MVEERGFRDGTAMRQMVRTSPRGLRRRSRHGPNLRPVSGCALQAVRLRRPRRARSWHYMRRVLPRLGRRVGGGARAWRREGAGCRDMP